MGMFKVAQILRKALLSKRNLLARKFHTEIALLSQVSRVSQDMVVSRVYQSAFFNKVQIFETRQLRILNSESI